MISTEKIKRERENKIYMFYNKIVDSGNKLSNAKKNESRMIGNATFYEILLSVS